MTDKMPELKPCPFCGSKNVSCGTGEYGDGSDAHHVECEECAATADGGGHGKSTKETAIKNWDTRADTTAECIRDLVGALERGTEGWCGSIDEDGKADPDNAEAGFWIDRDDYEKLKAYAETIGRAG